MLCGLHDTTVKKVLCTDVLNRTDRPVFRMSCPSCLIAADSPQMQTHTAGTPPPLSSRNSTAVLLARAHHLLSAITAHTLLLHRLTALLPFSSSFLSPPRASANLLTSSSSASRSASCLRSRLFCSQSVCRRRCVCLRAPASRAQAKKKEADSLWL